MVKNLPAMQETQVQSLDWEDPLEEEHTHTVRFIPAPSIELTPRKHSQFFFIPFVNE